MLLNDVGKFVGRYFQALACVSIASMMISPIFFDRLHGDVTFIPLLWAAHHLIGHNPIARVWTLKILGMIILMLVLVSLFTTVAGTDGMSLSFGIRVENPTTWQVLGGLSLLLVLCCIPFFLLLTEKARQEFGAMTTTSQMVSDTHA